MKIKDLISEKVSVVSVMGQGDLQVSQNGTLRELLRMVDDSRMKELRCLADSKNLYVWDSYKSDHGTMKMSLGLDYGFHLYILPERTLDGVEDFDVNIIATAQVGETKLVMLVDGEDYYHHKDTILRHPEIDGRWSPA